MRGIPESVTKQEFNSKKAPIDTRRTSKETVTEGYPKRTNIIKDSIYNTTPVHYISVVSEELKWVVKDKECFNAETGKVKN